MENILSRWDILVWLVAVMLAYLAGHWIQKRRIKEVVKDHLVCQENFTTPVVIFDGMSFLAVSYDHKTEVKLFDAGVRITRRWKRPRKKAKPSVNGQSDSST